MNEVTLVTGSESLTGRKLIEKLLMRGCRVIAPVAGKETETNVTGTENLNVLTWNRASWFSAKTVIRESISLYGRIDAAWIVHRPSRDTRSFFESGSSDIEAVLEKDVKGSLAIIRDLLPHLESSAGFLGMVVPHGSGGPMAGLSQGAFTGFTGAFIREAGPGLWTCGINSSSPDADGFTTALIRLWDEKPSRLRGRWYHYSEGRRLFAASAFSDSIG